MARRLAISGLHPLLQIRPDGQRGSLDPQIFEPSFQRTSVSGALHPSSDDLCWCWENFSSQGQRMPASRPEKFTVTQTPPRLAQGRISFPTENEPIFRYRRPGLKAERGAHFARIQTKANSQYAIQRTGVSG